MSKCLEYISVKNFVCFSFSQNRNVLFFGPKLGLDESEPKFLMCVH